MRVMEANAKLHGEDVITLGVRPEYVTLALPETFGALPATVTQAQDIGTYWLITARVDGDNEKGDRSLIRARLNPEQNIPRLGEVVWLNVIGTHTCFYRNEELIA